MDEEELKTLLAMEIPEPSKNFADRIILAAHGVAQRRPVSLWNYVQSAFAECFLPRPAFVLASMLVLGIVFGLGITMQEPLVQETEYVQDAFTANGWGI